MTRIPSRPIIAKAKPIKDVRARRAWADTKTHCSACGVRFSQAWLCWREVHHLVKRGRSDETSNWLALCARCHKLCEGERVVVDGEALPFLCVAAQLWLKRRRDPGEYDRKRLEELKGEALPDPQEPPEWFMAQWKKNCA